MEEQPPPLTPEEITRMQSTSYDVVGQPQTVKIFGITHIVFGAYGIFMTLFTLIALFGINPFLSLMPKSAEVSAQMEQQAAMQAKMLPISILGSIILIATTTFIIIAGILMLKRRRSGLKWSNRYAWTSLLGKALNVFASIFYTIPLMRESMAGGPKAAETIMIASTVLVMVITCIYPVLSLILLNRPKTKAWFANQPV